MDEEGSVDRRWADPAAFRVDPRAAPDLRPSRRQSIALLVVLLLVAGTVAAVSYLIRPDRARAFDLLHGSVLIGDQFGPVNVDLASGHGTLQLRGADAQVGVTGSQRLSIVSFDNGTLLLNNTTGEFNMVDSTGFVIKRNGGVTLGGASGSTSATGTAAGQYAYIERTGPGGTDVLLVGPSTVALAAASSSAVKARGTFTTPDVGSTAAGGSASANGDLWAVFTAANGTRTVRQLSLPANSSTGVTLTSSDHGKVGAVVALESATAATNGSGGDVVGVATPGRIQIFAPGKKARTVRYTAPAGTDTIMPSTNARGRLSYLLHSSAGWSLLSVDTAGTRVVEPVRLGTIEPTAGLATPAQSLGSLYTMVRSGSAGSIYRISAGGKVTSVAATYPQKMRNGRSVETASFNDGYLIGRGSRVVVDSPGHYLALTVFTDGSHTPVVVEKTRLTSLNAAGGAEALTRGRVTNDTSPPSKSSTKPVDKPKPTNAPAINNKINCKQVTQKPHVPIISGAAPTARSIGLAWTYPIYDNSDCQPSTYVVSVALVSNNAPPAPASVTLQGHTDTVISGLYPNTTYQFTVTAYINGQSTPSQPRQIRTGKEGPASPSGVAVSTDSSGNWDLSWRGCGTVSPSCVPADTWSVLPSFCDGRGLSASPAPLLVPADPSSLDQPPTVFTGSDSLLGRGLQFRVQGISVDGTVGTPSALSGCEYSYSAPIASAMKLSASLPPQTSFGATAVANVTLNLGSDVIRNVGGVGSTVALTLTGGGQTASKGPFTVTGDSSTVTASFPGLRAGASYLASAVVTSAHGGLSATIPSAPVTTRAGWPASSAQGGPLGVSAQCATKLLSCDLSVTIDGLTSSQANGEHFTLAAGSNIRCNNSGAELSLSDFDPATAHITKNLSQLSGFYGTCQIQISLLEDSTPSPLYFGGTQSPILATNLNLGQPQTASTGSSDFAVSWSYSGGASTRAEITYAGSDPTLSLLTQNWQETLSSPTGAQCGTNSSANPPGRNDTSAHYITVDPTCMVQYGGSGGQWTVSIRYDNVVGGTNGPLTTSLAGPVPGYQPPPPPPPPPSGGGGGSTPPSGGGSGSTPPSGGGGGSTPPAPPSQPPSS